MGLSPLEPTKQILKNTKGKKVLFTFLWYISEGCIIL